MRQWLIEKRRTCNLSQKQIADKVGITREFYSMIESGSRRPSVDKAKKIARILGFDWTEFFRKVKTSA